MPNEITNYAFSICKMDAVKYVQTNSRRRREHGKATAVKAKCTTAFIQTKFHRRELKESGFCHHTNSTA